MKTEDKLVYSPVNEVVEEAMEKWTEGKTTRAAERAKRAEARLQELIGFTVELLNYYNATPDEWDHFKAIIGEESEKEDC